jgi:hypothetical protein
MTDSLSATVGWVAIARLQPTQRLQCIVPAVGHPAVPPRQRTHRRLASTDQVWSRIDQLQRHEHACRETNEWYAGRLSTYGVAVPIPFPELTTLLDDHVLTVQAILGRDLIGFYIVGSFAVGDADLSSDCDFIAAVRDPPSSRQEDDLRALHRDIPSRSGLWPKNLEGSYAPLDDLRTLDALGRPWLYVDRGWSEMQWSTHCNSLEQRWTLRECAVVLTGPSPTTFAAPVPGALLSAAMAEQLPRLLEDLATWIDIDTVLWGQRYAVESLCRMYWTFTDGNVHSKAASLDRAVRTFDPRWADLLRQAQADRSLPWNPTEPPHEGNGPLTRAFALEVLDRVGRETSSAR